MEYGSTLELETVLPGGGKRRWDVMCSSEVIGDTGSRANPAEGAIR